MGINYNCPPNCQCCANEDLLDIEEMEWSDCCGDEVINNICANCGEECTTHK